jgi:Tol biopolymer transport system component
MRKLSCLVWLILFILFIVSACNVPAPFSEGPVDALVAKATHTQFPKKTTTITSPIDGTAPTNPTDALGSPVTSETEESQTDPLLTISDSVLHVVYTNEGNLWLWKNDGAISQLTDSYEAFAPQISPDGKLIAYLRGKDIYNAELWVINTNGSGNRVLVNRDDLTAITHDEMAVGTMIGAFDWIPGQHTLAYNTIQLFEIPSSHHNNDLRLVDVQNGNQTVLFESGKGGKFTYSPDGTQIALSTPESISIVNADGSDRRDILNFPVIFTDRGWLFYPQPVWAPDSTYLRVAIPPQDPLNNPQAFTLIWHIPADGSLPYMAGEFVSIPAYNSAPLISPDTKMVIFLTAIGEAFDELELRVLNLTNGAQTPIYTGNISLHNWNPDSVHFVFSQDFGTEFYLGEIASPPNNLTDVPVRENLEWYTSEQFIFTSGDNRNRGLRIGKLDKPSTIIANSLGEQFAFDFYPKP